MIFVLTGRSLHLSGPWSSGSGWDCVALVERVRLLFSAKSQYDDPTAVLQKTRVALKYRHHGNGDRDILHTMVEAPCEDGNV